MGAVLAAGAALAVRRPEAMGALPWAPFGGVGLVVTVTSVPMPYSALSTLACAAFTPDDAPITVMTRPIPMARPMAMKIACRILRRSSRLR